MDLSNTYLRLHDEMIAMTDSLWVERDPVKRLALADALERDGMQILRKIKYESAYAARTKYSAEQISLMTHIDRKHITYLMKKHLAENPQLSNPTRQQNQEISDFIDLRHLLAKQKEIHLQSKSPTDPSSELAYTQDHGPDEQANHSE